MLKLKQKKTITFHFNIKKLEGNYNILKLGIHVDSTTKKGLRLSHKYYTSMLVYFLNWKQNGGLFGRNIVKRQYNN